MNNMEIRNKFRNNSKAETDDPPKGSGWATMTHGQTMVGSKEQDENKSRSKSFFESLKKSNVTSSEVKQVAEEIEEIQKQKTLSLKKSIGTLTPEEELLLRNLNKKYGDIGKDNNKKSHDNKKQNKMSR